MADGGNGLTETGETSLLREKTCWSEKGSGKREALKELVERVWYVHAEDEGRLRGIAEEVSPGTVKQLIFGGHGEHAALDLGQNLVLRTVEAWTVPDDQLAGTGKPLHRALEESAPRLAWEGSWTLAQSLEI